MMFLIIILFYIQQTFINLYKKQIVFMSINNSNTLYNMKHNYTLGYDNRYPIYEKNMRLVKNNMYKLHIKKNILDILENKDISINEKNKLLQKYKLLYYDNGIKITNLKAGNLMDDFDS